VESAGEILRAIQSYAYADSDTDATRGKIVHQRRGRAWCQRLGLLHDDGSI